MLVTMQDACFCSVVVVSWEVKRRYGKPIDLMGAAAALNGENLLVKLVGTPLRTCWRFLLAAWMLASMKRRLNGLLR